MDKTLSEQDRAATAAFFASKPRTREQYTDLERLHTKCVTFGMYDLAAHLLTKFWGFGA